MLEIARAVADGRARRSITFVSTSGGSGGNAGAADAVKRLGGPVDAVLVLGDLASVHARRPFVVGWSNSKGVAPLQLQRTIAAAVRSESGAYPGFPRGPVQWARLAFPATVGEQGSFLSAGMPAALLSVTGERPPAADSRVSTRRLQSFGRAALRTRDRSIRWQIHPHGRAGLLRRRHGARHRAVIAEHRPIHLSAGVDSCRRRTGLHLRADDDGRAWLAKDADGV